MNPLSKLGDRGLPPICVSGTSPSGLGRGVLATNQGAWMLSPQSLLPSQGDILHLRLSSYYVVDVTETQLWLYGAPPGGPQKSQNSGGGHSGWGSERGREDRRWPGVQEG